MIFPILKDLMEKGIPIKKGLDPHEVNLELMIDSSSLEIDLVHLTDDMRDWSVEAKRAYITHLILQELHYVIPYSDKSRGKKSELTIVDDDPILAVVGNKIFVTTPDKVTDSDQEVIVPSVVTVAITPPNSTVSWYSSYNSYNSTSSTRYDWNYNYNYSSTTHK